MNDPLLYSETSKANSVRFLLKTSSPKPLLQHPCAEAAEHRLNGGLGLSLITLISPTYRQVSLGKSTEVGASQCESDS